MTEATHKSQLRRRAEAFLTEQKELLSPRPEEAKRLVYEMEVHQTELELQNQELRNLNLELEAARDRFREIFDFAPVGHLVLDAEDRITQANLEAAELCGLSRSELTGRRIQDFVPPEHQDRLHLHQMAVRSDRKSRCEIVLRAKGERERHVRISSISAPGAAKKTHVSLVDISDRVAAESTMREARDALARAVAERTRELEESQRLSDRIADSAPLLLWVLDVESRSLVYANAYAFEHLGYRDVAQITSLPADEIFDPSDLRQLLTTPAGSRRPAGGDDWMLRVRTTRGATRWMTTRVAPFEDSGGRRLLGASVDVTELRHAQLRIRQLNHEASLARDRERRKLSSLLHDSIGQLLPLARTRLALASSGVDGPTRERLEEVGRLIHEAHTTATSLASRLNPAALQGMGLDHGIRAVIAEMQRDWGLGVTLESDDVEFELSDAVEFAVYRVVRELLTNVAKHADARDARVILRRSGSHMLAIVEDSGRGFDPSLPRRGLGLTSTEEEIRFLGGRLTVRSEPDRGTQAELRVPLLDRELSGPEEES